MAEPSGTGYQLKGLYNYINQGILLTVYLMAQALRTYDFLIVFGMCPIDRESKFENPHTLETEFYGTEHMSLYYCDPIRSNLKDGGEQAYVILYAPARQSF